MKGARKIFVILSFVCLLKSSAGSDKASPQDNSVEKAMLISALSKGEMTEVRRLLKAGAIEEYLVGKNSEQRKATLEKIYAKIRVMELLSSTGLAVVNNGPGAVINKEGDFEVFLVDGTELKTRLMIDQAKVRSFGHSVIKGGKKPLHVICMLPDVPPEVVKVVLENSIGGVNVQADLGTTPLVYAALAGNLDLVKFLVKEGAHVNDFATVTIDKVDKSGYYPYLKVLTGTENDDVKVKFHYTPLVAAVWEGNLEIAKFLLENGAKADNSEQSWGQLFHPVYHGRTDMVELLLKNGTDVNSKDPLGWTALHKAVETGNTKMVVLLLRHGADVNATDINGWTPFHVGCFFRSPVLELLLKAGSDVLARTKVRYSPLNLVLAGGDLRFLQYLVDIFDTLQSSSSSLQNQGSIQPTKTDQSVVLVDYLINRGASFNDQDDVLGFSPLHWAAASGALKVAQKLAAFGAVVSTRAKIGIHGGLNPLETARYFGRIETAKFLETVRDLV